MTQVPPIAKAIQSIVDAGELAGAVALIWRVDQGLQVECVGWRNLATHTPMVRDTLFRIASMTKPITSLAALMLWEEGRFALSDPISRWAPEFRHMRVLRTRSGPVGQTAPAQRPITFEDLLTHRAGFSYADFEQGPIAQAYAEALGGNIDNDIAPDDWMARLASLPLIDQPGAAFHYSHATDLLGLLMARMEDVPLGDVLERRIFGPVGMKDTAFTVAQEKRSRCAALHGFDEAGHLTVLPHVPGNHALPERPADMRFVSGGQGLWSTVDDYLAFARLFVEHGTVDGVRLMQPQTLAMMTTNCLSAAQRASSTMLGMSPFAAGHGFGLGVAVVMEPEQANPLTCGGGIGAVGWPGAYGGWWQADPNDGSVLIFLTHNMFRPDQLANGIGFGAWDAIMQFQALAAAPR